MIFKEYELLVGHEEYKRIYGIVNGTPKIWYGDQMAGTQNKLFIEITHPHIWNGKWEDIPPYFKFVRNIKLEELFLILL